MIKPALLSLIAMLPAAAPAGMETVVHQSEALGREQTYHVYLPADAAEDRRYPVVYVFHGAWGSADDWPTKSDVRKMAEDYRLILVFPDGGEFGWFVDSPMEANSQYETYVTKELIQDVDSRFPTLADRETRSIMGLSMGGHGAFSLSAKHPELFRAASSTSGIMNLTNHPDQWEIAERLGEYINHEERWKSHSVVHLAEKLRDANVRLMFDCGRGDTKTGAIDDNRELHARLKELKVPHIYRELDGTHSWEYWSARMKQHLNFHQAVMVASTPNMERWFDFYYKRMDMHLKENEQLAVSRPELPTICLLGSSSAQGMPSDLFPGYHVFNRGIGADRIGLTSRGVSHRMEESIFDMKPDIVVMKIGRNDLSAHQSSGGNPPVADVVAEYERVAKEIRRRLPDAKYIITTSFPVRGEYERFAHLIPGYNEELRGVAERNGAILIDVFSALVGEDGLLKPEYSADGLHLSAAGKAVWAEMVLEALSNPTTSE